MGKSSSNDELTIRNQFDRICKLALKGEAADYYRHIAYRQKHEVLFSELSQKELDSIFGVDKYTVENKCFRVLGYDIEVKDTLLSGLLTTCNLMGISFPHTLAHNHRYVYWFPFTWSQCDNFSSLTFPAGYEIWIFL